MIKIKKQLLINKETFIFLGATLIVTGLYAYMMHDKTMPLAEGWYTYYAQCIQNGLLPYKDFEFVFTPFYLLYITLVTSVFGFKYIVLRRMGILFFCLIAMGVFLCIQTIVGKKKSWIACIAACSATFYMQSENAQIFYDYVRFMDIFVVFSIYSLLLTVKKMLQQKSYKKNLIITSFLLSCLCNIKQNEGLILIAFTFVFFLFTALYLRFNVKKTISILGQLLIPAIIIQVIIHGILTVLGILPSYLEQTGANAVAAKGGMLRILLRWIVDGIPIFKDILPESIILFFIIVIGTFFKTKRNDTHTEKYDWIFGVMFCGLSVFLLLKMRVSEEFVTKHYQIYNISPYAIFIIVLLIFIILGFGGLYCILKNKREMDKHYLIFAIAGSYFAISYASGTCGGLAVGQATLGLALIISLLLDLFLNKYTKIIVLFGVISCVGIVFQYAGTKMVYTYYWWEADESNYWSCNVNSSIPGLERIQLSPDTEALYKNIYDIIINNSTPDNSIYCFPQIPIFYTLTDRQDPGTMSKVQWFDVSSDETLISDINIIKKNPPKIIILYNTPESAYIAHEELFNGGDPSGTRQMREFLYNYVYENSYTFLGKYTAYKNSLQIWVRNDNAMPLENSCFSGGDGSIDNPYLIETAEQLVVFSKMVNDGRNFENYYIKQVADIDLNNIPWIPMGEVNSGNCFLGVYDGNGHIIKNLNIENDIISNYSGLFGNVAGEVHNLKIETGN